MMLELINLIILSKGVTMSSVKTNIVETNFVQRFFNYISELFNFIFNPNSHNDYSISNNYYKNINSTEKTPIQAQPSNISKEKRVKRVHHGFVNKRTPEHRSNISIAGIKYYSDAKNRKKARDSAIKSGLNISVKVKGVVYETMTDAAKAHNIVISTVRHRCESDNWYSWEFVDKDKVTKKKKVVKLK